MDDLIQRQAVLEMAYDLSEIDGEHFTEPCMVVDVEDIQKLQPVNLQEPKTGHWITTRTFMHDGEYYCDKCKCDSPNNEKWDYCPNCGVRMESEE